MSNANKPVKHDLFNAILKQGLTVHVDFDPWARLVNVPPSIKCAGQHRLRLDFDSVRCRDIKADLFGLEAGMTFAGAHWTVYVPWVAVFCIAFDVGNQGEERGILYNDDLPASVIDEMVRRATLDEQQKQIDAVTSAPKQASLQGGAKIYNFAEERARRAARKPGPPAG